MPAEESSSYEESTGTGSSSLGTSSSGALGSSETEYTEETGTLTEETGTSTEETGTSTEETGTSTEETRTSTEETETGQSSTQSSTPGTETGESLTTTGDGSSGISSNTGLKESSSLVSESDSEDESSDESSPLISEYRQGNTTFANRSARRGSTGRNNSLFHTRNSQPAARTVGGSGYRRSSDSSSGTESSRARGSSTSDAETSVTSSEPISSMDSHRSKPASRTRMQDFSGEKLSSASDREEYEEFQVYTERSVARSSLAELAGSFFLVYIAMGAMQISGIVTFYAVTTGRICIVGLAYGFSVAALQYAFSFPTLRAISILETRQLNPSVTFALFLTGHVTLCRALHTWVFQFLGGLLAVTLLNISLPPISDTALQFFPEEWHWTSLLTTEALLTFVVILISLTVPFGMFVNPQPYHGDPSKRAQELNPLTPHEFQSILVGFITCSCFVAGSLVSGAFLNPVMAFSACLLSRSWSRFPFYMVAHAIASAAAGLVSNTLFIDPEAKQVREYEDFSSLISVEES